MGGVSVVVVLDFNTKTESEDGPRQKVSAKGSRDVLSLPLHNCIDHLLSPVRDLLHIILIIDQRLLH